MRQLLTRIIQFLRGLFQRIIQFFTGLFGPAPIPTPTPTPVPSNNPPAVNIVSPLGGIVYPQVRVLYDLFDDESDVLSIEVTYSTDGGTTFLPASESAGGVSQGTTGLSSSPAGENHLFIWDSESDLNTREYQDLLVKIQASDAQQGGSDTSPLFDTSNNIPPSIQILDVFSNRTSPVVPIDYLLADDESDLSRIRVEYSADGGATYRQASESPDQASEGVVGLRTTSSGIKHRFIWDAASDLPALQATGLFVRIQALDTKAGGEDIYGPFSVGINIAPKLEFLAPGGGTTGSPVIVRYLLTDPDSDLSAIVFSYSTDGGTTFHPATEAQFPGSEGLSGLSASARGQAHIFLWDAAHDLNTSSAAGVLLKGEPSDADPGTPAVSAPFDIGMHPSNPRVKILGPNSGSWGGYLLIMYELSDPDSDPLRIEVSYSLDDGLTFLPATEARNMGSEGTVNLTSSPTGVQHMFMWDALTDVLQSVVDDVIVKVAAFDPQSGEADISGPFTLLLDRPCRAHILSPVNGQQVSSPVAVEYELSDFEYGNIDIGVQYSTDNGITFQPATEKPGVGSEGTSGLTSRYSPGELHVFVWDAQIDLATTNATGILVRIQPSDAFMGVADVSEAFDVVPGAAPEIEIQSPSPDVWGAPVPFVYALKGTGTLPVTAAMQYSTDGGNTFHVITEAQGVGSEGLTDLSAGVLGDLHFFAWDYKADISAAVSSDLLIQITATDFHGTTTMVSEKFNVDTAYIGAPVIRRNGTVTPPEVGIPGGINSSRPTLGMVSGIHIPIWFFVRQTQNERTSVVLSYRFNAGKFKPATLAKISDKRTNLAASGSIVYRLVWDALADIGENRGNAEIKITPYVGNNIGISEVRQFQVDIRRPAAPPAIAAHPSFSGTIVDIENGNNQVMIGGLLAPEALKVKVKDSSGGPLKGVRVFFEVVQPNQNNVTFEDDVNLHTITDGNGIAGIRIRPKSTASDLNFEITATVVGVPTARVTFDDLTAKPGVIRADGNNPVGPLEYGRTYNFGFYLDGDNDLNTVDFLNDPDRPVVVTFSGATPPPAGSTVSPGTNLELDRTEQKLTSHISWGPGNYVDVALAPNRLDGTAHNDMVHCTLAVAADPNIADFHFSLPIETATNTATLRQAHPTRHSVPVRVFMKLVSGIIDPTKMPQVGYPAVTLTTPFKVEMWSDIPGQGQLSKIEHTIDSADAWGCRTLGRLPLDITWTASGGTLSTSQAAGTDSTITVPITRDVYFTPQGPGPWTVTPRFSGWLLNPYARWFQWTNSNGDPMCDSQNGLQVSVERPVLVQIPTDVSIIDIDNHNRMVSVVKPGQKVKVMVAGLSPYAASSNPADFELISVYADGDDVPVYNGYQYDFKQNITMHPGGADSLLSEEFLIIRGTPQNISGKVHSIIPHSWLRGHAENIYISHLTSGLRYKRIYLDNSPSVHESPQDTSPFAGYGNTVALHNGEFILSKCDFSLPSKTDDLDLGRTWRSHSLEDGDDTSPLGPGWHFNWSDFIDISRGYPLVNISEGSDICFPHRYRNHTGFDEPLERGYFIELTRKFVIDRQNSAFELTDAHRTAMHFEVDGSLKFSVDRLGNKTQFNYNKYGQLMEIQDPLAPDDRKITLTYWEAGPGVVDEWVGRLKEITDYTYSASPTSPTSLHKVNYTYYGTGDTNGGAGWLKTVELPACTTWRNNQAVMWRRNETYQYERDTQTGWKLKRVLDSKSNLLLENEYSGNKIEKQKAAGTGKEITFSYDRANRKTTVEDAEGKKVEYTFPVSPYWDGTTPSNKVEYSAGNQINSAMEFNVDGHMTSMELPETNKEVYVYDQESSAVRSRGNLLRLITVSASGAERETRLQYESRYNLISKRVDPRGNISGVDAQMYATGYGYDYQYPNRGDKGNVVMEVPPSAMHRVSEVIDPVNPPPRSGNWWNGGYIQREYNLHGMLIKEESIMGVVTRYYYFPKANWNGMGPGVTATRDGEGLPGRIEIDTELNPRRTSYLPNVPLETKKIEFTYDERGNLTKRKDDRGVTDHFTFNIFNELEETVEAGEADAPLVPLSIRSKFYPDENGFTVRNETKQPQASSSEGGDTLYKEYSSDNRGNIINARVNRTSSDIITNSIERYKNDTVRKYHPYGHTDFPDAMVELTRDGRNITETVKFGGGATQRLSDAYLLTDNGSLKELSMPGNLTETIHSNDYKEDEAVVDSEGNVSQIIVDEAGTENRYVEFDGINGINPGRQFPPAAPSPGYFNEQRVDEFGRMVRVHEGLFYPASARTGPGSTPLQTEFVPKLSESLLPSLGAAWPPVNQTGILDGVLGQFDGRTSTDISYDHEGKPTRIVDDDDKHTYLHYDSHGRLVQFSYDRQNLVVNIKYHPSGQYVDIEETYKQPSLSGSAQFKTVKTRREYDALGRVISEEDTTGDKRHYDYNVQDQLIGITNSLNQKTIFKRDGLGNIFRTEMAVANNSYLPGGKLTHAMAYYADGRIKKYTDNAGNDTVWQYYSDGELKKITYYRGAESAANPFTDDIFITYSSSGFIDTIRDANHIEKTFFYEKDRLVRILANYGTPVAGTPRGTREYEFEHDGQGNITGINDLTHNTQCKRGYDSLGNLQWEQQVPAVITCRYEGTGRVSQLNYPQPAPVDINYLYDSKGRLKWVKRGSRTIAYYKYSEGERPFSLRQGRIETEYTYDDNGVLSVQQTTGFSTNDILNYNITPDSEGRITTKNRQFGHTIETNIWNYAEPGWIKAETYTPVQPSGTSFKTVRLYDGDEVLREETVEELQGAAVVNTSTVTRTREERGRITSYNGTAIGYNDGGNCIDDGRLQYDYDAWNRLIQVTQGGQVIADYEYDGFNRLVRKITSGTVEEYIYYKWQLIEVRINGNIAERYIYSDLENDFLIHCIIGGVNYTVLHSPVGNIDALVDDQENIVERYRYALDGTCAILDAYGQPLSGQPRCRLLFQRHMYDSDSGLYQFRRRWYHPLIGQFLTPDILGFDEGSNQYGLNHGDAVNFTDQTGFDGIAPIHGGTVVSPRPQPPRITGTAPTTGGSSSAIAPVTGRTVVTPQPRRTPALPPAPAPQPQPSLQQLERRAARRMGISVPELQRRIDEWLREYRTRDLPQMVAVTPEYEERRRYVIAQREYRERMAGLAQVGLLASNTWFGPGAGARPGGARFIGPTVRGPLVPGPSRSARRVRRYRDARQSQGTTRVGRFKGRLRMTRNGELRSNARAHFEIVYLRNGQVIGAARTVPSGTAGPRAQTPMEVMHSHGEGAAVSIYRQVFPTAEVVRIFAPNTRNGRGLAMCRGFRHQQREEGGCRDALPIIAERHGITFEYIYQSGKAYRIRPDRSVTEFRYEAE